MSDLAPFEGFGKIPRLNRDIVVTEKIDGTNAQVFIDDDLNVYAGSRNRYLIDEDNFGFAAWVREHESELRSLGPGRHYGEWWGQGVGRGYDLTEKRFSLFNTGRWAEDRPECCHVVPVLYAGPFDQDAIDNAVGELRLRGSVAAPGFMRPEGVIVWHEAARQMFKVTLENDDKPKALAR